MKTLIICCFHVKCNYCSGKKIHYLEEKRPYRPGEGRFRAAVAKKFKKMVTLVQDKLQGKEELLQEELSEVQAELFTFAGLLQKFKVDERMAHTALENDAKKEMKQVSMSVLEEFATAIKQNNLEYFVEILDIPLTNRANLVRVVGPQKALSPQDVIIVRAEER